ncbi:AAA-ATPase [Iris pallida]|uniref:AAA-ATPase n=1 Tax=Iris pallida TaxID=29817 RepID=A0AAX6GQ59_IRIPA|nr:AAA-ATPase [Iris pallida]
MGTTVGAAVVAAAVLFLVVLQAVLSVKSLRYLLHKSWQWLDDRCHVYKTCRILRFGDDHRENPLFNKAMVYINSLPGVEDSECLNILSTGCKPNDFFLHPDADRSVVIADTFLGSRLSWTLTSSPSPCLSLRLRCRDRRRVLRPYLRHVETVADGIDARRKELRLFYVHSRGGCWSSLPLSHPSTLETVAVDAELKGRVKDDLEAFLKGKGYYARVGRVWRRSYLLHGPSGTGKSSFAVAMARFLNYDIYDVDLSKVSRDPVDLKSLLARTSPRSVILVEDLDRYVQSGGEEEEGEADIAAAMTKFVDGVVSCCGAERVIVFTTGGGGGEREDAVVEAAVGRLDMHVSFPLCDFTTFKTLAASHLGLKEHKLYPQVEEGFWSGSAKLRPAEVGEMMIANRGSPSRALRTVISALRRSSGSLRNAPSESETYGRSPAFGGLGKEHSTVRELKNLYGLIRTRGLGSSKKEGTMSVEMAAAAANYVDRSFERDGF